MIGEHKLVCLCEALLVSRSGYYAWLKRRHNPGQRQQQNLALTLRIKEEFVRSRQTYGSPRLARVLGGGVSRKRVARLMRIERIWARQRSKFRVQTTDSGHADPIAPNLLPKVTVERPDQVWVTDATCFLTRQGWLYVVAI